jgi:hypothetical protein
MGRKALMYSAGLIALYLVVINYTGAVHDTNAAAQGGAGLVRAFQGR